MFWHREHATADGFQHTWHWVVYGSAHFLSDATPCSTGPASDSSHRGSAAGWVYNDGSWNQTAAVSSADVRHIWQGNTGACFSNTETNKEENRFQWAGPFWHIMVLDRNTDRRFLIRNKIFQTAHTPVVFVFLWTQEGEGEKKKECCSFLVNLQFLIEFLCTLKHL